MREFARDVAASLIASLIFAAASFVIGRLLFGPTPPLSLLSNPIVQFAIIAAVAFVLIIVGVRYLRKKREELIQKNAPKVYASRSKPKGVLDSAETETFGVKWKATYGTRRVRPTTDEPYVYVEGPYCPEDDTKLSARTVSRFFIFDRRVWVCSTCRRKYPRPTQHMFNEERTVKKQFQSYFEKRASQSQQNRSRSQRRPY